MHRCSVLKGPLFLPAEEFLFFTDVITTGGSTGRLEGRREDGNEGGRKKKKYEIKLIVSVLK